MRFVLVSAEDSSIKRPIEVPDDIVVRKRGPDEADGNPRKKLKKTKPPPKPINRTKSVQRSKSVIR